LFLYYEVLDREDVKMEVQLRAFMILFLMEWSDKLQAPAVLSFSSGDGCTIPIAQEAGRAAVSIDLDVVKSELVVQAEHQTPNIRSPTRVGQSLQTELRLLTLHIIFIIIYESVWMADTSEARAYRPTAANCTLPFRLYYGCDYLTTRKREFSV